MSPKYEARGIRTPNLRVWNPTRYRCAIASYSTFRVRKNIYKKNYLQFLIPMTTLRNQENFFVTKWNYFSITDEKKTPSVGIEPTAIGLKGQRSTVWAKKALDNNLFSRRYLKKKVIPDLKKKMFCCEKRKRIWHHIFFWINTEKACLKNLIP